MSARHLESLRLSETDVESTTSFLKSYADTCLEERGALRDSPKTDRHRETGFSQRDWALTAEAASSEFEAGQWAMLTDAELALSFWWNAGWLYREIGFGFGHYLLAVTGARRPGSGMTEPMASALSQVVAFLSGDAPTLPEPLLYPQQQTYLLLAAATAATGNRDTDLAGLGRQLVERSPVRSGVAPVGALGTPVRTLWQVADWLLNPSDEGAAGIAEVLIQLTRQYGEAISLAMVNHHLWSNGAAPVDVGSFDMASLATSALFVYPFFETMVGERAETALAGTAPHARSQMQIAFEVARLATGRA